MNSFDLLDPTARGFVSAFPVFDPDRQSLEAYRRVVIGQYRGEARYPRRQELFIAGPSGSPDVRVLVYRPRNEQALAPAIVHLHGGGFFSGTAGMIAGESQALCDTHGAFVVAVDYRLAPEVPFPGPLEDCYTVLRWLFAEGSRFNIDLRRVVVMGGSAGGGLAAALALLVRDRAEFVLKGQMLIYPMLDARTGTCEAPIDNPLTGQFVWTRRTNQFGWSAMRGDQVIEPARLGHFSPSLAHNLCALPETFIAVGALDLLLEESADYALRLARAGVAVEAHIYPGAPHGFRSIPGPLGDRLKSHMRDALERILSVK